MKWFPGGRRVVDVSVNSTARMLLCFATTEIRHVCAILYQLYHKHHDSQLLKFSLVAYHLFVIDALLRLYSQSTISSKSFYSAYIDFTPLLNATHAVLYNGHLPA